MIKYNKITGALTKYLLYFRPNESKTVRVQCRVCWFKSGCLYWILNIFAIKFSTYYFKFCRNCRLSSAWYLFFFCPNFCPHKKECPIFKGWLIQKKVQWSVFLGVWVNCDGSLSFRRTLPRALNSYFYYILRMIRKILSLTFFSPNL
jgi:hypothetical protein